MIKPLWRVRHCLLSLLFFALPGGVVAAENARLDTQVTTEEVSDKLARELEAAGYALEMPPGAPMGAAYIALRNLSASERVLARVELPSHPAGKIEMHTTQEVDGVSRMRPLKKIALPGHGTIEMRPGATHLMVHGVTLKAGELLPLRLVFADGTIRDMRLPVYGREQQKQRAEPGTGHHHGHHHHG
ncbi:copper chaperone PCu(A)C [Microbulbifer salipaludis]|uniref:Copper chaperone PCu(A)C n=1 Tax=Microbulbifer salipaludis TaxID=187980 RepID=A0ABS3E1S7_9GAMM|nr:copper chaperone PCu(A)C [Microbulbifer salipaludis]MBN8429235.1 copper chaperone PCu(A)C [Microbulbifer salipaludis]